MVCNTRTMFRIFLFLKKSFKVNLYRLSYAIPAFWQPLKASSGSWKNLLFDRAFGSRENVEKSVTATYNSHRVSEKHNVSLNFYSPSKYSPSASVTRSQGPGRAWIPLVGEQRTPSRIKRSAAANASSTEEYRYRLPRIGKLNAGKRWKSQGLRSGE